MAIKSKARPTLDDRVRASSRARREEDKAALRDAIFRAAGDLLLERGFEAFSLRQVAERVGYSATTIYRYFENKDDLVFGIVDEGFRIFGDRLRAAAGGASEPLARLRAVGEADVRFGLEFPVYYRLMFVQRPDFLLTVPPGMQESRIATFRVLQGAAEEVVAAGWRRVTDARALSDAVWAMLHGIVSLSITVTAPVLERDALSMLATTQDVLEAGLRSG
ncbi:MAG: TetR/AcrR family transcriptional regulator [Gemmatimonadaceae bacterium]